MGISWFHPCFNPTWIGGLNNIKVGTTKSLNFPYMQGFISHFEAKKGGENEDGKNCPQFQFTLLSTWSKMAVGIASVAKAFGESTIPEILPSHGQHDKSRYIWQHQTIRTPQNRISYLYSHHFSVDILSINFASHKLHWFWWSSIGDRRQTQKS